ncbi:Protein AIG2 [Zostera marina]|uniref:Putative gamma-glutamylcyclotransferase n=1 Tax=Zostera marina TaxID=29655 RepID=A0A0K9NL04_ZOSMR|nr:Protein AIG2 [Zostera marina]
MEDKRISSPDEHMVFVYGTLMDDQIVKALLKRVPSSFPAILHNHNRYKIEGRVYPAIIPEHSKIVTGKVYPDITDTELDIFDYYEDSGYDKRTVEVVLIEGLEKLTVHAYVWKNKNELKLHGDWSIDEWKQKYFEDYYRMTIQCIEDYHEMRDKDW